MADLQNAMVPKEPKLRRTTNTAKVRREREEVFSGARTKTSGGPTKDDLVKNKKRKIASKRRIEQGKQLASAHSGR